jgi:phosphate/sulfate permease
MTTLYLARFMKLPISATHGLISSMITLIILTKGVSYVNWNPMIYKVLIGWGVSPIVSGTLS